MSVKHLRGSVYLIEATRHGERPFGYVASLASIGPDGAFLVDSMVSETLARKVRKAIEERGAEVRFVGITHAHPDHVRGNGVFADDADLIAHVEADLEMSRAVRPIRWLPKTKPVAASALPSTRFRKVHRVVMNDEQIVMFHLGPGHTAGDAFVFFEEARVVHVGDSVLGGGRAAVAAPISGGSFEGLEAVLGALLERLPPDAIVVSGHGPAGELLTVEDVRSYRRVLRAAIEWVRDAASNERPSEEQFSSARVEGWKEWTDGKMGPETLLKAIWDSQAREADETKRVDVPRTAE